MTVVCEVKNLEESLMLWHQLVIVVVVVEALVFVVVEVVGGFHLWPRRRHHGLGSGAL